MPLLPCPLKELMTAPALAATNFRSALTSDFGAGEEGGDEGLCAVEEDSSLAARFGAVGGALGFATGLGWAREARAICSLRIGAGGAGVLDAHAVRSDSAATAAARTQN